jgi:hypothetical protein
MRPDQFPHTIAAGAVRFVFVVIIAGVFCLGTPGAVRAMDLMYSPDEIQRETPWLKRAVENIYHRGIAPVLSGIEWHRLGQVVFQFPPPRPDSSLLNFYVYRSQGRSVVVMPVLSLKQLEDLMITYAWLQQTGHSHATIDLYYAMLKRRPKQDFPSQRYPDILTALGVPKTAIANNKQVDATSLSLRNEAIAFVLVHELGHIFYRHKSYSEVTAATARADELQADRFALDLMVRTDTPPMGAVVFFQAQAYAMPHRGEYPTEKEWHRFLRKYSTHPLSTERIALLANVTRTAFAARRAREAATWRSIADLTVRINDILEDLEIHRCIAKVSRSISFDKLKPTRSATGLEQCLR